MMQLVPPPHPMAHCKISLHDSPGLGPSHMPSTQADPSGHCPQEPPQPSSPHRALSQLGMQVPQVPQPYCSTSEAQMLSQYESQQKGSRLHTHSVTVASWHPGVPLSAQQSPLQGPQSSGHWTQFSLKSTLHMPSPHPGWQGPQSSGQVSHPSPPAMSQAPSPQSAGQVPQS